MKSIGSIFVALAVFLLLGLPAMAQPEIYGIGTEFPIRDVIPEQEIVEPKGIFFNDSVLYKIDPDTGIPLEIGPITGYTECTGLDIHPDTEEFFAVCVIIDEKIEDMDTKNGLFGPVLLKLDRATGQGTEVGPLGEFERGDFVSDISFRSDGTLFAHINGATIKAAEDASSRTVDANSLGIINTQTGQLTILGPTGSDDFWSAIGFTPADTLIQCTDNRQIPGVANILNQTNGNATFLANLIYPPEFDETNTINSKDFDLSSGHFLAFLDSEGGCCEDALTINNHAPRGTFLVRINPNNGVIELIGQTSGIDEPFAAIAVLSEKTEIPTLSEYGLILTVVMLLGVAVVFLRRRQTTSGI